MPDPNLKEEKSELSQEEVESKALELTEDATSGWMYCKRVRLQLAAFFRQILDESDDFDESSVEIGFVTWADASRNLQHLIKLGFKTSDLEGEMRLKVERIIKSKLESLEA